MGKKSIILFSLGVFCGGFGTFIFLSSQTPKPTVSISQSPCEVTKSSPEAGAVAVPVAVAAKLLDPPAFASNMPETFEANFEGELRISWVPTPGALRTRLVVLDQRGRQVKTFSTKSNYIFVKDLPRPSGMALIEFQVALQSINVDEKVGPVGQARKFILKGKPELVAPEIKTIKIED